MHSPCSDSVTLRNVAVAPKVVIFRALAVLVTILFLFAASEVRADNQKNEYILSSCCGGTCGSSGCTGSARMYVSWDNASCTPSCYMTALIIQGDAGCGLDKDGTFRFIRESGVCTNEVGDPFDKIFPLSSPFVITSAELAAIQGADVVVEAYSSDQSVTLRGTKSKTDIGNPSKIPAASTWGLAALSAFLLTAGTIFVRRQLV